MPFASSSSIAHYRLFAALRARELPVTYCNLLFPGEDVFFQYAFGESFRDPESLGGVRTLILAGSPEDGQPELEELIHSTAPDLILARSARSIRVLRHAAASTELIFMTNECASLSRAIHQGRIADFQSFSEALDCGLQVPSKADEEESEAMQAADLIISPSDKARFALEHYYPTTARKISLSPSPDRELCALEAKEFTAFARPFEDRDIDVLFVAREWRGREKNLSLLKRFAARNPEYSIHVAGDLDETIRGAQVEGYVSDRGDFFRLLGRTKVFASISLFDPAPRSLPEAAWMGCNLVTGPNVGYSDLCPEALLMKRTNLRSLEEKTAAALMRPYPSRHAPSSALLSGLLDVLEIL